MDNTKLRLKPIVFVALWIVSLAAAVLLTSRFCAARNANDANVNAEQCSILYEGKTYVPFETLANTAELSACVVQRSPLSENQFTCELIQGNSSLGKISFHLKDGKSDGVMLDGVSAAADADNIVVLSNRVYIDSDAYQLILNRI